MTTPTQAQIEAAAKALFDYDVHNSRTGAVWETARLFYFQAANFALTAAAQVGEPRPDTEYAEGTVGWAMAVRKMQKNATIERCAQVADALAKKMEELAHQDGETAAAVEMLQECAAAIRKLKDTPCVENLDAALTQELEEENLRYGKLPPA